MTKHALKLSLIEQAQICASTEQTRYYLNGVFFDPAGVIVATDGHLLGAIKPDPDSGEVTSGFFEAFKGRILATLPPAALKTKAPDKRSTMCAFAVIDDETNALTVAYAYDAAGAAEGGVTAYAHPKANPWVDGTFPDWRRVVPREAARGALDASLGVSSLLYPRIASFFQEGKAATPLHAFPSFGKGAIVYRSDGAANAFLLAMSMRSTEIEQPLPAWALNG